MNKTRRTLLTAILLSVFPIFAQPFKLDIKKDAVIAGTLLAGEIFHNVYERVADDSEYDGKKFDKDDVNGFDRFFMNRYNKTLSNVGTGFMIGVPAAALLFDGFFVLREYGKKELLTEVVMFAETILMSHTVPHVIKPLVKRARPYNYYDGDEARDTGSDHWERSFFSGHTTMVFAAATFGTYTFCKYFPDSKIKPQVIAVSYALATATAITRICSGCHFMTDVLVGAAAGSAIGFFVPWLHSASTKTTQLSLSPAGFYMKKML